MIDTMSVVTSRFEVIRNGAVTEHNLTAVGDDYFNPRSPCGERR